MPSCEKVIHFDCSSAFTLLNASSMHFRQWSLKLSISGKSEDFTGGRTSTITRPPYKNLHSAWKWKETMLNQQVFSGFFWQLINIFVRSWNHLTIKDGIVLAWGWTAVWYNFWQKIYRKIFMKPLANTTVNWWKQLKQNLVIEMLVCRKYNWNDRNLKNIQLDYLVCPQRRQAVDFQNFYLNQNPLVLLLPLMP